MKQTAILFMSAAMFAAVALAARGDVQHALWQTFQVPTDWSAILSNAPVGKRLVSQTLQLYDSATNYCDVGTFTVSWDEWDELYQMDRSTPTSREDFHTIFVRQSHGARPHKSLSSEETSANALSVVLPFLDPDMHVYSVVESFQLSHATYQGSETLNGAVCDVFGVPELLYNTGVQNLGGKIWVDEKNRLIRRIKLTFSDIRSLIRFSHDYVIRECKMTLADGSKVAFGD
jgi:hypothetical protein